MQLSKVPCVFPEIPISHDIESLFGPRRRDIEEIRPPPGPTPRASLLGPWRPKHENHGFRLPALDSMNRTYMVVYPAPRLANPSFEHSARPQEIAQIARSRLTTTIGSPIPPLRDTSCAAG